jgi:nitrogen fixation/metabolism regulation signal transduction histidine kinase
MKNKSSVFGMFIATLIFAVILFMGLTKIDPRTAELTGFIVITAALLLFLWALIGTLMLAARKIRKKDIAMAVSLRQASFLSMVVVLALYLQRFELLTWWNVGALIILVVLIEVFFIGKEEVNPV